MEKCDPRLAFRSGKSQAPPWRSSKGVRAILMCSGLPTAPALRISQGMIRPNRSSAVEPARTCPRAMLSDQFPDCSVLVRQPRQLLRMAFRPSAHSLPVGVLRCVSRLAVILVLTNYSADQPAEDHGRGRLNHRRLFYQLAPGANTFSLCWRQMATLSPLLAGTVPPLRASSPRSSTKEFAAQSSPRRGMMTTASPQLLRAQHLPATDLDGRPDQRYPRPPAGVYRG